jgi:hypothetical protein
MGHLYGVMCASYIQMKLIMFNISTSITLIVCGNYITTNVNVTPNQQLRCNYYMATTHLIMSHVHISTTHYM